MISAVIKYKDDRVSIHSSETEYVGKIFKAGFYRATTNNDGQVQITEVKLPEIHNPFMMKGTNLVIQTVDAFFQEGIKQKVEQLGFTHKLGALLYGIAGTGKTSLMHFVAKRLVDGQGGIVLFCDNNNSLATAIGLASSIREIQSNPIIFIADEFEQYCKESESALKNFLDGKDSVSNSLFIGATNYIDRVPETLKDRPSRFKVVLEIKGIEDRELMKVIINDISERIQPSLFSSTQIDKIVNKLDSATLDQLKHICLDRVTNTYIPKGVGKRSMIGFKSVDEEEDELGIAIYEFKEESTPIYKWTSIFTGTKEAVQPNTKSNI